MDVARNRDGETDTVSGDEVDTTGRLEPPSDAGLGPASEGERGRDTDRTVGRFYHGDLPYTRRYYPTYGPYYGRVQRNDEDIWRDIQIGMDWDEYVNPDHVRVQVQDGVVTLEGAVASPLEKRSAGDDAWDTPGVRDVRNRLSISGEPEPVATGERWEVGEKVTVESSRREREGEALPQIQGESSAGLGPGAVDEERQGERGGEYIRRTQSYNNRYYYRAYGPDHGRARRDDDEIARDVRYSLVWDTYVDEGRIDVDVKDGMVTLKGSVDTIVEKRSAGDDAWDTPGVRDVRNELVVQR
jgi:osmotically-inducible protein OsmY